MHTPGPWSVEGLFVVGGAREDRRIAYTYRALVYCPEGESVANALLISAAPDLLEALKFVQEHIADPERKLRDLYPAFGLNASRALDMVAAAIAKAEGRS